MYIPRAILSYLIGIIFGVLFASLIWMSIIIEPAIAIFVLVLMGLFFIALNEINDWDKKDKRK